MASKLRHDHAHRPTVAPVAEPARRKAPCQAVTRPSRVASRRPSLPTVEARPHPSTVVTAVYEADETEYMVAVQQFKARTGRLFPTCSDYLAIAKSLGYSRPDSADTDPAASEGEGL